MTAIIKDEEVILVASGWTFRKQVVTVNLANTVARITLTESFSI
ncbi:hypothetical protein [Limosilactobacillus caviae]|nr:hypothetical protein [Limosilactobacillus caviae]